MEDLGQTLKLLSEVKDVKVANLKLKEDEDINLMPDSDAIFIFDTVENYLNYLDYIQIGKAIVFRKNNVYCTELTSKKLQVINKEKAVGSYLIEEDNKISLYTMTEFTKQLCHVPQLKRLHVQCFGRRELSFYILENK